MFGGIAMAVEAHNALLRARWEAIKAQGERERAEANARRRREYAMAALTGILAGTTARERSMNERDVWAEQAWAVADTMMAAAEADDGQV